MGLQGMINDLIEKADFNTVEGEDLDGAMDRLVQRNVRDLARCITAAENNADAFGKPSKASARRCPRCRCLASPGQAGAGKSSMVDELVRRFLLDFPGQAHRPGERRSLQAKDRRGVARRPHPHERHSLGPGVHAFLGHASIQPRLVAPRAGSLDILKAAEFDLIVLETSGIGQSDTEIMDHSDVSLYVMTPEFGAATQLEKIDMLDFADVVAINKFDKRGAQDALRDVRKQFKRNHDLWDAQDDDLPVVGTIASQFNDPGTNELYRRMMNTLADKTGAA